jgi:energy-coupling factor transport system ATP-binding protein
VTYDTYNDKGDVDGKLDAVKSLSLEIAEGSFTAILGSNGSGKSTFAKLCAAILAPAEGAITVCDIRVTADEPADDDKVYEIRRNAGMVFQNPDNQLIATVVEEDVAFGLENLGVPRDEMRRRIDDVMHTVGIYEFRKHAPHHLSGGQKQRVAIAGIIAMEPRVLILDEPTAMLDPKGRGEVMKTAHKLHTERGITVLLITHYMEEAATADRIVVMSQGSVVMDGTPKQIFSDPERVKSYGLDVPQVTELTHALIAKGFDLPKDIITEDECISALSKLHANPVTINKSDTADTADTREIILQTDNLSYKYGIGTPFEVFAVKDVSLKIKKGEFLGIIGHTGSGKSTLIQTFNGLLKPYSGKAFIGGLDIWAKKTDIKQVRFKAGLVFQYSEHQLFGETVYKDIAYGPTNMGLSADEIKRRVEAAATLMGLTKEQLKRSPFDLSGGQQRRAALAGVIAMEPEVLILDEPAAGLDPSGREKLLETISNYRTETGKTVILVSHSMEDIVRYAERVLVMNKSGVFLLDKTENIFSNADSIEAIGLSLPQITRLMKNLGVNNIYTVKQAANCFA